MVEQEDGEEFVVEIVEEATSQSHFEPPPEDTSG